MQLSWDMRRLSGSISVKYGDVGWSSRSWCLVETNPRASRSPSASVWSGIWRSHVDTEERQNGNQRGAFLRSAHSAQEKSLRSRIWQCRFLFLPEKKSRSFYKADHPQGPKRKNKTRWSSLFLPSVQDVFTISSTGLTTQNYHRISGNTFKRLNRVNEKL